jgi:YHYH protein
MTFVHASQNSILSTLLLLFCACSSSAPSTSADAAAPVSDGGAGLSPLCSYETSALNSSASVNATATVKWSCTSTTRQLTGNGLPDHEVGTFPNADNPNAISAQTVTARFTLAPTKTDTATTLGGPRGTTGFILNGVKIDADTNGGCNDSGDNCSAAQSTGQWNMEALGQTSFKFGVDSSNAHVQPGGAYHYHGLPEGFINKLGKGKALTLIGWAADGFPIYARYGYTVATDATSAIKEMTGSYRLKAAPDANRPAVTLYAMGTFKQDYEYAAGSGDLDECNGRMGVTPEFPNGTYHYYATSTYPFLQRCVKGKVTSSGMMMPPMGGGGGMMPPMGGGGGMMPPMGGGGGMMPPSASSPSN